MLLGGISSVFATDVCEELPDGRMIVCAGEYTCGRLPKRWICKPNDGRGVFRKARVMGEKRPEAEAQLPKLESRTWENKKQVFAPMRAPSGGQSYGGKPFNNSRPDARQVKANARNDKGSVYYKNGEYEKAIVEYSAAIELNPKDAAFHNNRGNAFYMLKRYEEAVDDYNNALSLRPDLKEAIETRASALEKLDLKNAAALRSKPEMLRQKPNTGPPPVQSAGMQPQANQGYITLPNPVFAGQGAPADAQRYSGWSRPPQGISALQKPEVTFENPAPPAEKPADNSWRLYCAIGFLLAAAAFPAATYLALISEHDAMRKELQPLADKIGVSIRWLFFGFFVPPDSGFYGRLLISLAIYSALGSVAACFVYFNFSLEDTIKILSGPLLAGVISSITVFNSYSLKTGNGKKDDRAQEAQQERTKTHSRHRRISSTVQTRGAAGAANASSPAKSPPPDLSPYDPGRIENLMKAGKYKEALELFSRKNPLKINDADKAGLFEIYIRLGDYARAGHLFESLKGNRLLTDKIKHYEELAMFCREHKEDALPRLICRGLFETMKMVLNPEAGAGQYYGLAEFCENMDDAELARDIFDFMIYADLGGYKDVAARYQELKARLLISIAPAARTGAGSGLQDPASGALPPAIVLDKKYELKGELGEGGMAKVYEGWDRVHAKKVAVKKMHSWLKRYPVEHARFVQEARIVSKLNHPNIVGVHGIIEQESEIYLIFDYVDGKTLADLLKEKISLPFEECKQILKGVCEAISYAHKNNIIHRDLKPGNIMLDKSGTVLVMDFGLASELRESFTRVTHQTSSGTPAYMGPEQYLGIVKRESDVYAIGVCLYEMLTGKLPFAAGDIMQQKNDKAFSQVSAMMPWLPSGLDELLTRSLDPEPSHRFADPMDFFDALSKL